MQGTAVNGQYITQLIHLIAAEIHPMRMMRNQTLQQISSNKVSQGSVFIDTAKGKSKSSGL